MNVIKEFYTKKYPTDDLGFELSEKANFKGLKQVLDSGEDVYEYIGVADSLVRERLFEELGEVYGISYDEIYNQWLSADN